MYGYLLIFLIFMAISLGYALKIRLAEDAKRDILNYCFKLHEFSKHNQHLAEFKNFTHLASALRVSNTIDSIFSLVFGLQTLKAEVLLPVPELPMYYYLLGGKENYNKALSWIDFFENQEPTEYIKDDKHNVVQYDNSYYLGKKSNLKGIIEAGIKFNKNAK